MPVGEGDLGPGEHSPPAPAVAGEVGGLLRRAPALDRRARRAEQRRAAREAGDELGGLGRELGGVVRRRVRCRHRLGEPGDEVPGELESGTAHEDVVAEAGATCRDDLAPFGVELDDGLTDPVDAAWHDGALGSPAFLDADDAAADERPQRLVVVDPGGLDERDVSLARPAQPGGDGDPRGAAPDDDDSLVHRAVLP